MSKPLDHPIRVLVIGGGPSGYVAAIRAAQLGAQVTLIERGVLGGTCLNVGCIPTKALLHSAQIYTCVKNSAHVGVQAASVHLDWESVQANRRAVVNRLTVGVRGLLRSNGVEVIQGESLFTGIKQVTVGGQTLTADRIIIATGSKTVVPPIPGIDLPLVCVDSSGCLELDHLPKSLLVIGGGVIGIELGTAYAAFGTAVTIVEALPRILPAMDQELTGLLHKSLAARGLSIRTNTKVLSVERGGAGAQVRMRSPEGEICLEAEKVLVCVGRTANTESLRPEAGGLVTDHGRIPVNERLETNQTGVYAVGDCTGILPLAHAAMAMGEIAAENAMGGNRSFRSEGCPSGVYGDPELASVGATETQLQERGIPYLTGHFPISANGRCLTLGQTDGMIKVLAGARYGELLGVHILAPNATELIQEGALALRLEATLNELGDTIHSHPTVSEALHEAVLAAQKRAIHIPNR